MIYLVRHGQSEWNLLRRTQGQIRHPALTALGRGQARRAAAVIAAHSGMIGQEVGSVVTSDLVRAAQSAAIVAAALAVRSRVDRRWREQGFGRLEGLGYDLTSPEVEALAADPDVAVGGGETDRAVTERALAALSDLDSSSSTVVVTHGDTIRHLLGHLVGIAPGADLSQLLPNGTVIAVDRGTGGWGGVPGGSASAAVRDPPIGTEQGRGSQLSYTRAAPSRTWRAVSSI